MGLQSKDPTSFPPISIGEGDGGGMIIRVQFHVQGHLREWRGGALAEKPVITSSSTSFCCSPLSKCRIIGALIITLKWLHTRNSNDSMVKKTPNIMLNMHAVFHCDCLTENLLCSVENLSVSLQFVFAHSITDFNHPNIRWTQWQSVVHVEASSS